MAQKDLVDRARNERVSVTDLEVERAKFIGCEVDRAAFDLACERIAAAYAQGSLLDLAQPVPEQQGMGF